MAGEEHDHAASDALRHAQAIDSACDRFESKLRKGGDADLRSELDKADPTARPELFKQLLGLQMSIAIESKYRPALPELVAEFPEYSDVIHAQLAGGDQAVRTIRSDLPMEPAATDEVLNEIQPETRYQIGDEVARGGMGAIYLAEESSLLRNVAVKTMLMEQATPEETARFIEEAQITGQLDHPGIVPVHELGVDGDGRPFYSMKYVRGRDLYAIFCGLRDGDAAITAEFPLHRLLSVFDRVCDAVAFAHAHGVIHRDIKPANIRIGAFGEVLMMDWGLAKLIDREEKVATQPESIKPVSSIRSGADSGSFHTIAGSIMGSPQYMAPEQASGETTSLDERADIYALGAILYEILTLEPPVELHEDVNQTLMSVTSGNVKNPLLLNRISSRQRKKKLPHCPGNRIPDALAKVAMRALQLERDDRYASVSALQREVDAWIGGFATMAENAGLFRQIKLFVRRNKLASAAAVVLVCVLTAATALSLYQRGVAVKSKGEAETALNVYLKSVRQRAEQARKSAPAYLKSALVLEQQGEFDDALIAVEGALRFDPELAEGYRIQSLLLARAGRWEEALAALDAIPEDQSNEELRAVLKKIITEPDSNSFPELARIASGFHMPSTSTDFLAQSAKLNAGKYGDSLPIWRAKLKQAWGFDLGYYEFRIDEKEGLTLKLIHNKKGHKAITSLEALRGIPIESLKIEGLPISDLTPLRGMPLRRVDLYNTSVESLDGLEQSPVQFLRVNRRTHYPREYFSALRGKQIESLLLGFGGTTVDTTQFSEFQCNKILFYSDATSLAFISDQKNLHTLNMPGKTNDEDYRPVLKCPTLKTLRWANELNRVTLPVWHQIANGSLSHAKEEIVSLRKMIRNEPSQPTRELLDMIEFFIDRKTHGTANPADYKSLANLLNPETENEKPQIIKLDDGRAYYLMMMNLRHGNEKFLPKALAKLDIELASIRSQEDQEKVFALRYSEGNIMTGGFRTRKDSTWQWRDGSPWTFDHFAANEKNKPFFSGQFRAWYVLRKNIGAMNSSHFLGQKILIQFPAEWLESAPEKK